MPLGLSLNAIILAYNEEARITRAIRSALAWADSVAVMDKSSTDNTVSVARAMGVDIISLPFSEQGHDDLELIRCSSGDGWVFAMTPSDLPTPALIDAV